MTLERPEAPSGTTPRQPIELTEGECWRLLRAAPIGRVVFTHRAMPAIRPVNHIVDGGSIIIKTGLGAAVAARARDASPGDGQYRPDDGQPPGSVVCYEADELDPVRHTGWSVIVTGLARLVTDPADITRYNAAVHPWIAGEMNQLVAIEPRFISGLRLVGWCS